MSKQLPTVLEVGGGACLTVGAGLAWLPAGLVVAGVLLLLFGLAAEREG